MARALGLEKASPDIDAINLSRVLSRLEHKILSSSADPHLKTSSYERTKTSANVEYARDLLLRLEHSTSGIKVQSRKQAAQTTLVQQRALIKRLNDRLYELNQQDDGNYFSISESDEDLLGENAPAPSPAPSSNALSTLALDRREPPPGPQTETTSTLRSRLLSTSPASTTTAHSLSVQPNTPTPTAATLLESDSTTQAQLTDSMLSLATALKQSSLVLSKSLADDTISLDAAAAALDKNTDGLASATKKMGMLRSMSEGRWWWGRMLLYACIAGLWILALGIVFVGPKLRF
ncbi:hypothetical protein MMC30_008656 [Trapelia coarctata]|nr:hypothetical protein [Trapelia coarctata]